MDQSAIYISDINAMKYLLDNLDRSIGYSINQLEGGEENLKLLQKSWVSETEDEESYFVNAFKNFEDVRNLLEACKKIENVLRDYSTRIENISNNGF